MEPEVGGFQTFWKEYIELLEKVENKEKTLQNLFLLDGYSHGPKTFSIIGEKIDKLFNSDKENEKQAAILMNGNLMVRCSIRAHPYWIFGHKDGILAQKVRSIREATDHVLNWFIAGKLFDDNGEIPSYIGENSQTSIKIFEEITGKSWKEIVAKMPPREEWISFINQSMPKSDCSDV